MSEINYDEKLTWTDFDGTGQKLWFACPAVIEEVEIVGVNESGFFPHWQVKLAGNEVTVNEESLFNFKAEAIKHIHHMLLVDVETRQRQMVAAKGELLRFEEKYVNDVYPTRAL